MWQQVRRGEAPSVCLSTCLGHYIHDGQVNRRYGGGTVEGIRHTEREETQLLVSGREDDV